MQELQTMEMTGLIDLLAQQTQEYYRIVQENGLNAEAEKVKAYIGFIQAQIDGRNKIKPRPKPFQVDHTTH